MPEVTYMGHRLIPRGIIADPEKIEAVTKMAAPQDVSPRHRKLFDQVLT